MAFRMVLYPGGFFLPLLLPFSVLQLAHIFQRFSLERDRLAWHYSTIKIRCVPMYDTGVTWVCVTGEMPKIVPSWKQNGAILRPGMAREG